MNKKLIKSCVLLSGLLITINAQASQDDEIFAGDEATTPKMTLSVDDSHQQQLLEELAEVKAREEALKEMSRVLFVQYQDQIFEEIASGDYYERPLPPNHPYSLCNNDLHKVSQQRKEIEEKLKNLSSGSVDNKISPDDKITTPKMPLPVDDSHQHKLLEKLAKVKERQEVLSERLHVLFVQYHDQIIGEASSGEKWMRYLPSNHPYSLCDNDLQKVSQQRREIEEKLKNLSSGDDLTTIKK